MVGRARAVAATTAVLAMVGCSFDGVPPPSGNRDGGADARPVPDASPPVQSCLDWGRRGFFEPCDDQQLPDPMAPIVVGAGSEWRIDTATGDVTDRSDNVVGNWGELVTHCDQTVRVVSTAAFFVEDGARLIALGPHALVIASWSVIYVLGEIDVSSKYRHYSLPDPFALAAGANAAACDQHSGSGTAGTAEANGGGGGGGGGFGEIGGSGGAGRAGMTPGAEAGSPIDLDALTPRGGCAGGNGGEGDDRALDPANAFSAGFGGAGGGAIVLTAATEVLVWGRIHANGQGGRGPSFDRRHAGGGGGSGGLIALEAPSVMLEDAALTANGGGGGGGSNNAMESNTPTLAGQPGAISAVAAPGGVGENGQGGDGGAGGALAVAAGMGTTDMRGGGGGGGGVGVTIAITTGTPVVTGSPVVSPVLSVREPDSLSCSPAPSQQRNR